MTLIKPEKELKEIDRILNANPKIIDCVHSDLVARKIKTGSKGISAEQILRSAVLKQYKRYTYRELVKRLNDGVILRWFSRFYSAKIPHYTSFQKAIKHISFETWDQINDILVEFSKAKKLENGRSIRVDTTVTECNIAYPVDARLLNDSVRILTRWMERSVAEVPGFCFSFSNRTRRVKKRCYQIVMAKGPNTKKIRKKCYVDLIKVANEVFRMASRCCDELSENQHWQALHYHEQLDHFLTLSAVAIDQCERRILNEEQVPASDKIVSIFEEHTDIIKRGKTQSPTEFGHKVLVASGKSGIITPCKCFRGNPCDGDMVSDI
jgi:IS5 family transposase